MGKFLKTIALILVGIFVYSFFIKSLTSPVYYKGKVDVKFQEKIDEIIKNNTIKNIFEKKVLKNDTSEMADWDGQLVKVDQVFVKTKENGYDIYRSKDVIQTSHDKGATWSTFAEGDVLCNVFTIYNRKLFCISNAYSLDMHIFEKSGVRKDSSLISHASIIKVIRSNNELYFIWGDERARWPNFWSFVPIPNGNDPNSGPWLVMAGKLNLDTLTFEEHVIKYDSNNWP